MPPAFLVPSPAAGLSFADAAATVVLLVFAVWGWLRGGVRQVLALGVLAGGIAVAPVIGRLLEASLARSVHLSVEEAEAAAWGVGLFGAWVVGAVLVSVLGTLWVSASGRARGLGALLGLVQGALLLVLVGQILLGLPPPDAPAPGLLRPPAGGAPPAPSPWERRLRESLAARGVAAGGEALAEAARLPAWLIGWTQRVSRAVAGEAAGRSAPHPR